VVVDNPTQRKFFLGYTFRLVSGGESTCYGGGCTTGDPVSSRLAVGTFEYFTSGAWYSPNGTTPLFDTDTDAGVRIDVTLTGEESYRLTMTPLDNLGAAYSEEGSLANPGAGPIDWIQFELYNSDSDFYPTGVANPSATDFYIGNITIVPEPGGASLLLWGAGGATLAAVGRRIRGGKGRAAA
jgi:hypothetical protein